MSQQLSKLGSHILVLTMVAIIAVGCGRRGGLEAPSNASVISTDEYGETRQEEVKEDKPFILDALL